MRSGGRLSAYAKQVAGGGYCGVPCPQSLRKGTGLYQDDLRHIATCITGAILCSGGPIIATTAPICQYNFSYDIEVSTIYGKVTVSVSTNKRD